jgi:DNA-binding NtrC family response regulator
VRIVAASNAELEAQVDRLQFRRDLLFRLRVLYLRLPPLRERPGDVGLLAQCFVDRLSRIHQRPPRRLARRSLETLETYSWPGNVRELESVILREFLMQDGDADELVLDNLTGAPSSSPSPGAAPADFNSAKRRAVAEFETSYLRQLLRRTSGNISLAARVSRKDRNVLKRLLRKHGISASEFRDSPAAAPTAEL